MNKSMQITDWLLLFLLSLLWGGSFFFNEIVLRQLSPFTLVFTRVSLGAVFLWIFVFLSGERPQVTRQLVMVSLILGILNNFVPFSLIVWGQQYIEGGEASIINAASPLFSAILGQFLRGGAYKPRTSPYAYQGLGRKGLKILARVRKKTGNYSTEVPEWWPNAIATAELLAKGTDCLRVDLFGALQRA